MGKRVVALHLILQRPDERDDDSNLLDSTGKLRGYQPYYFAASDFAGGVQKSAYGELRVIDLRKLGLQMRVKVADVHVEPTPANPSQRFGYQFDNLTLEVTTQGLSWQHRVCAVHTLRLLYCILPILLMPAHERFTLRTAESQHQGLCATCYPRNYVIALNWDLSHRGIFLLPPLPRK